MTPKPRPELDAAGLAAALRLPGGPVDLAETATDATPGYTGGKHDARDSLTAVGEQPLLEVRERGGELHQRLLPRLLAAVECGRRVRRHGGQVHRTGREAERGGEAAAGMGHQWARPPCRLTSGGVEDQGKSIQRSVRFHTKSALITVHGFS